MYPGNNESASKRKSSRIQQGNKYLKVTLTELAWGSHTPQEKLLKREIQKYGRQMW